MLSLETLGAASLVMLLAGPLLVWCAGRSGLKIALAGFAVLLFGCLQVIGGDGLLWFLFMGPLLLNFIVIAGAGVLAHSAGRLEPNGRSR